MVNTPRSNTKVQKLPTEQWGCEFGGDSGPDEIIISGRKGYNETMNGLYRKGKDMWDGRICYLHTTRKFAIRWSPVKESWFIDWRGLKSDTTASAALAQNVESPHLATQPWRVYDGKKWISDAKLTLTATVEKSIRLFEPSDNASKADEPGSVGGVAV